MARDNMALQRWARVLRGDRRIVAVRADVRDGAIWVYAECGGGIAAWRLLRSLQRWGDQRSQRRSWTSVWLGPA